MFYAFFIGIFLLPAALIKTASPSRSAVVSGAGSARRITVMMKNSSFNVSIPRFYDINAGAQLVLSSAGFRIPSIRRTFADRRVFGHVRNAASKSSAVFGHIRVCVQWWRNRS